MSSVPDTNSCFPLGWLGWRWLWGQFFLACLLTKGAVLLEEVKFATEKTWVSFQELARGCRCFDRVKMNVHLSSQMSIPDTLNLIGMRRFRQHARDGLFEMVTGARDAEAAGVIVVENHSLHVGGHRVRRGVDWDDSGRNNPQTQSILRLVDEAHGVGLLNERDNSRIRSDDRHCIRQPSAVDFTLNAGQDLIQCHVCGKTLDADSAEAVRFLSGSDVSHAILKYPDVMDRLLRQEVRSVGECVQLLV